MIDDVAFRLTICPPEESQNSIREPFLYKGIELSPKYRKGMVTGYYGNYRNLHIKLVSDRLTISNSLHKFYHGNNYGDYNLEEIKETLDHLAEVFGAELWDAEISALTVSCNLPMDAKTIYRRIINGKTKPFQEMKSRRTHEVYGKYLPTVNIKDKFYDKQFEVKQECRVMIPQTLRIEREIKMMKYVHRRSRPMRIYTPRDLISEQGGQYLIPEILNAVRQVNFSANIDTDKIQNFKDFEIATFLGNPHLKEAARKGLSPKTYKKWTRRYEELRLEHEADNPKSHLLNSVEEKMMFLLKDKVKKRSNFSAFFHCLDIS